VRAESVGRPARRDSHARYIGTTTYQVNPVSGCVGVNSSTTAGLQLGPRNVDSISGVTQTLVVVWLLALVLYEPLFVARAGGTIGHRSVNLRVVTASDLGPVSFPRAIVRAIVKAAVGIPVFLAVYFTAKHQGFHDLVAGTVVVPRDSSEIRNEWFTAERRRERASPASTPR
jgi:RDD family protein